MKDLSVKIKKGEKAYVFIPAHIKKPAKQLAAKRKMTLSKLVARLLDLQ